MLSTFFGIFLTIEKRDGPGYREAGIPSTPVT
jgi:hypothetical protein